MTTISICLILNIYVEETLCPFYLETGFKIFDEFRDAWDLTPYAKIKGKYILSIYIYDSEQKDEFLSGFSIDVINK